jgi:hypothetical protein
MDKLTDPRLMRSMIVVRAIIDDARRSFRDIALAARLKKRNIEHFDWTRERTRVTTACQIAEALEDAESALMAMAALNEINFLDHRVDEASFQHRTGDAA